MAGVVTVELSLGGGEQGVGLMKMSVEGRACGKCKDVDSKRNITGVKRLGPGGGRDVMSSGQAMRGRL